MLAAIMAEQRGNTAEASGTVPSEGTGMKQSGYEAQPGLKFVTLLPQLSGCWGSQENHYTRL